MNVQRTATFIIRAVFFLQVVVVLGLAVGGYFVIAAVNDHGLKAVIERIWQGPSNEGAQK